MVFDTTMPSFSFLVNNLLSCFFEVETSLFVSVFCLFNISCLGNVSSMNCDLKQELDKLRKRFELTELENVYLNKSIERMDKELDEAKDTSFHLSHQIENSKSG
ncbi:hypothetical protein AHAS_Ahas15G0223600 [Arachis hypogaea]